MYIYIHICSSAEMQGSFAEIQGSFAKIQSHVTYDWERTWVYIILWDRVLSWRYRALLGRYRDLLRRKTGSFYKNTNLFCVQGSSEEIWGPFPEIQGSFAEIQSSFARKYKAPRSGNTGLFGAEIQGSFRDCAREKGTGQMGDAWASNEWERERT